MNYPAWTETLGMEKLLSDEEIKCKLEGKNCFII
jgi:hypothetical protein